MLPGVEAGTTDSHLSSTTCFLGLSEDGLTRAVIIAHWTTVWQYSVAADPASLTSGCPGVSAGCTVPASPWHVLDKVHKLTTLPSFKKAVIYCLQKQV